jgi:hypothetical protein
LRVDRLKYWLGMGAQPSERVAYLLWRAGLMPEPPIRYQTKKSVSKQKVEGAEGGGGGGGKAGGAAAAGGKAKGFHTLVAGRGEGGGSGGGAAGAGALSGRGVLGAPRAGLLGALAGGGGARAPLPASATRLL